MSDTQQTQHNYFLYIPATVADDPRLDDSEKLLFGRLAALSNKFGYCFASNKYLGELTGVSSDEIKKRLKSLKDLGCIKVDTKKNGVLWDRKIYPNFNYEGFKQTLREVQTNPSRGSYEPYNNISKNRAKKQQQQEVIPTTPAAAVFSCLDKIDIPKEDKEFLTKTFLESRVELAVAWATHPSTNIKKSLIRALRWFCEQDNPPKINTSSAAAATTADTEESNLKFLQSLRRFDGRVFGHYTVHVLSDSVEFTTNSQGDPRVFRADSTRFKEDVGRFFNKINGKL